MNDERQGSPKRPLRRVPAVIRSWDGPNARIGCETDLSQMPWDPFDALGKEILLLVPAVAGAESSEEDEGTMERALRFIDHAIKRSTEFASLGDGADPSWQRSKETWEWIRDQLTAIWLKDQDAESQEAPQAEANLAADFPPITLPGAARTLEVASLALRSMPLATWRDAVATVDPDMPTREETILTLKGVSRLLSSPPSQEPAKEEMEEAVVADAPEPVVSPPPEPVEEAIEADISFEFYRGFDEGYQTGRKVGRALVAHQQRRTSQGEPTA